MEEWRQEGSPRINCTHVPTWFRTDPGFLHIGHPADKQQEEALDIEARGGNSAKNGGRKAKKEMGAN